MTNNTTISSTEKFRIAYPEYWLIWDVVGIAVSFLIFVVNLTTILTFAINRHLLRRSLYCLINLAVADMLFGLFSMVYYTMVLGLHLGLNGNIFMGLIRWTYRSLLITSLLSFAAVSLERVYATFFPFRHRTTRPRMYIAGFATIWLLPLPIVIIFQLKILPILNQYFTISIFALFLICLIVICTSYTAIFVQVKIQAKRIQPNQQQAAAIQIRQKREQHLAMTLFIVTVLSLITWLPAIIFFLYKSNISYVSIYWLVFSDLLQDTNSLINPIVYVFRMRNFRKALEKLIFKCSRDQQQNHPIGHHGNHDRQQQAPIELREL